MLNHHPMPFCNDWERELHFEKHGYKFRAVDQFEYERMADVFMFGEQGKDTHECIRTNAPDRVRLDFGTKYFCVSRLTPKPECLRTFYPVKRTTVAYHGGLASYMQYECGRIDL
jgi:hypothetical protein